MRHLERWSALIIVLALAVAGVGFSEAADGKKKKSKRARIFVEEVIKENVTETMPIIGRFVALQHGVVATRVTGSVSVINSEVGDRVKKGEVIAKLDTSRLAVTKSLRIARLKETVGALHAARAQLNLTSQEMMRQKRLSGSAAFSKARLADKQAEFAKFESEVAEKEAAVSSAEANLRMAEIDLDYANIRAPYDAVVAERHAVVGNFLKIGDQVMTLVNDKSLEVEADVPETRLSGIKAGRKVQIRFGNSIVQQALVRAIVPAENGRTRTRAVRFVPHLTGAKANANLAANQTVTVDIPISDPRELLTVHKDAVIASGLAYFVYVIRDKKAWRQDIKIGQATGERFVVLSGLKAGDIVATHGNEKLKPGKKVKIRER
jgi:RND family efflux transporter MFP subunit